MCSNNWRILLAYRSRLTTILQNVSARGQLKKVHGPKHSVILLSTCYDKLSKFSSYHLACCLFIVGLGSKYAGLKSGPELSDLMTEIASKVPAKWKEISIQLGLTLSDQKHFMEVTLGDPKQCFTFVFTVWKNRATRPYTWSTMIEVLESPAVDEMRLAQELRRKLQSEHGK